jgi:aminoglycoside phosphotransferase (APT) family kinase protein
MDPDQPPVLGHGRASVVYDLGDGTVFRQYRTPSASAEQEAEAMRRAARAGVPVPAVHAVDRHGITLDRVDGPTMLTSLFERPGQAARFGALLAELHGSLDATVAGGPADAALVHGDLHPGNVIMSPAGPVLIDWTNHRLGPRNVDRALTWLVLACFDPGGGERAALPDPMRSALLGAFLSSIDRSGAATCLNDAAAIRRADPATNPSEHARIERLLEVEAWPPP